IWALAACPVTPNSGVGRSKLANSLRVTATKAGYGCAVSNTTRLRGARSTKRGAIKQAAARVSASSPAYFELSRKPMSNAPAVSSGAMLRIGRSTGSLGAGQFGDRTCGEFAIRCDKIPHEKAFPSLHPTREKQPCSPNLYPAFRAPVWPATCLDNHV